MHGFLLTLCFALPPAPEASVLRVGIVAYEDFGSERGTFQQVFAELTRADPTLQYELALGSYGEVLNWLNRRLVDVAILTPGAFASILPAPDGQPQLQYLATLQIPAATTRWAPAMRHAEGWRNHYNSVCLVPESSRLETVEDLRLAVQAGEVEFLFVHPLSVSGSVVPRRALSEVGIAVVDEHARYTYSHSQSIRLLREAGTAKQRVAFVWDDAAGLDPSLAEGVRPIEFPALDALDIPHDVIVARSGLSIANRFQQRLSSFRGHLRYRFHALEDWEELYGRVRHWLESGDLAQSLSGTEPVSLDEITHLLLQFSRSQPAPPRLALVLSGGGAKCSYQVGAVAAIERQLAAARENDPSHPIDIGLVVGTSGGAINSLPVALGVTRTEAGRAFFRETWLGLDQRKIVRPPRLVQLNMGVWFALLQSAVVIAAIRYWVPRQARRGRIFAFVFTALAAVELVLGLLPGFSLSLLGGNHWTHHAWLWFSFGVREAASCLFVIGLGAIALEMIKARRGKHLDVPDRLTKSTLAIGLVGLPLLQLVTIVAFEETLSDGDGMRDAVALKIPELIDQHLQSKELPTLELDDAATADERLLQVSSQIINREMLRRDLVMTGSCLLQSSGDLPSDLYFYIPASPVSELPAFGSRGMSLAEHPQKLLDVVLGSGTIFPVFPPRRIEDFPRKGEHIELVDGGFAHNSPVEAAVLWGATHIILIEATPRRRGKRGNFYTNVVSSFRHLHSQAQLLDARSRGKVVIFSLAPEPPHLCVLDFADNLIAGSIERGYHDAEASGVSERQFRRTLGEPAFLPVTP